MAQDGPNGASSTLHSRGTAPRSEGWKEAQAAFLAGRVSRRAARHTRNTQKTVQNAERTARRTAAGVTAGSAADTFGEDELLEPDSEDDYEVPEPPAASTATHASFPNAQAIITLMKDMDPASKQMFLSLMTSTRAAAPAIPAVPTVGPTIERTISIPRIFNAAAIQVARSEENQRPPFSPRIMELAMAGMYLERSLFTNERILDMFVNQNDPKYQPKKRTIINEEGKTITAYTIDPSTFEDETELSHIRFDEAHANYRRWFIENAPEEAAVHLEAYDNHRQRCRDVSLVDEKDYVMVQRWCRDFMKRQTWKPTTWNEGLYHKEFEASRARYFETKVAKQMEELGKQTQRQDREHQRNESPRSRSTYSGPERTSSSSYPERASPYSRDRHEQQRSFRKDPATTLCLKCGDAGHMARECRATKTIKGGPLKIFYEGGKIFWVSEPKTQVCVAWNLHGVCEARNTNMHCHACTLCGTTKHHAASGKC
ncbi:hypothetical protein DFH09DRAFT_1097490 [Mycena vulgaris]|nr:hypothetical protein DFH09DRAFT_1097490 [Mycena vulgaris]